MAAIWGAAIGAGASLLGGALSSSGASGINQQNVGLAREQMAWETQMSNTAVERRADDIARAGFNPILAVSSAAGGASTPGTPGLPQLSNPQAGMAQGLQSAGAIAADAAVKVAQAKNIDADTANKQGVPGTPGHAVAYRDISSAQSSQAAVELAHAQQAVQAQVLANLKIDTGQKALDYEQAVQLYPYAVSAAKTNAALLAAGLPAAQADAAMMSGPLGKYIPYLDEALKAVGVVGGVSALGKVLSSGRSAPGGPPTVNPSPSSAAPPISSPSPGSAAPSAPSRPQIPAGVPYRFNRQRDIDNYRSE